MSDKKGSTLPAFFDEGNYETVPFEAAQLRDIVLSRRYWVIQANATEWMYTVVGLIREFIEPLGDKDKDAYFMYPTENHQTYFLRRDLIPAEVVAVRLGFKVQNVKRAYQMNMKPLAPQPKVPTVPYWGTA